MAEILGAVASGFAVAEVGLKVGGTVWKLKKLWEEVHEVPATIQDLMRQIEIMDPILCDHENTLGNQNTALPTQLPTHNTASAMLSAAYCREALNDLRYLVEDLDVAIESEKRSRRALARMRVVLKKDTIRGFQDRLNRAIRLIQSIQVSYLAANATITGAMVTDIWTTVTGIQAQQQLILQQLSSSSSNLSSSTGKPPFPVVTQHVETSRGQTLDKRRRVQSQPNSISIPWSGSSIFGAIAVRKSEADISGEATHTARIQLPKWLSQKVWDISINRACSGWQLTISTWNIVPDDSPGMLLTQKGDLDGLIDLFNRGLASPQDCRVSGTTIFDVACHYSQAHIVKHLLNMDVTRSDITEMNIIALRNIVLGALSLDILQPLLSSGSLDPLISAAEDLWDGPATWSPLEVLSVHCLGAVARKQDLLGIYFRACFPHWQNLPPRSKHRILMLDFAPRRQGWTPDALRFVICAGSPIRPIDAQEWINDGASLLHLMFDYYLRIPSKAGNEDWSTLMEEVIKATDDTHYTMQVPFIACMTRMEGAYTALESALVSGLHHISFWCQCLGYNLKRPIRHGLKVLTENLQSLMSLLASFGYDLLEFGRHEASIWAEKYDTDPAVSDALYVGIGLDESHNVRAVHYGAKPMDWYFEMENLYEDYVEAFWNQIENPHLFMVPGAWIDE